MLFLKKQQKLYSLISIFVTLLFGRLSSSWMSQGDFKDAKILWAEFLTLSWPHSRSCHHLELNTRPRFCAISLFVPNCAFFVLFLVKRVLGQGPEQREPNKAVLCLLIIIILISYYYILLIMENHPSWNRKRKRNIFFVLFQGGESCDELEEYSSMTAKESVETGTGNSLPIRKRAKFRWLARCQCHWNFFPSSLMPRPHKLEHLTLETLSSWVLEFEGKARSNPVGGPFRCST
jgi:hypothetical protein